MNLKFPFKNIAFNSLYKFIEEEDYIRDYIDLEKGVYIFDENFFNNDIERYRNCLPNFENELLQIISTTSQSTIKFYFEELKNDVLNTNSICSLEEIVYSVDEWNKQVMIDFNIKVENDSNEYFRSDNRKMKHLEIYKQYRPRHQGLAQLINNEFYTSNEFDRVNYNYYCIEDIPNLIDETFCNQFYNFINELKNQLLDISNTYINQFDNGQIFSKVEEVQYLKSVIFVEGEHDITYLKRAALLLGYQHYFDKVEIRQRGGFANLDKLWSIYRDNNWETNRQKKLLLYDCDTNKIDEQSGDVFKRVISTIEGNLINKGIENLFPNSLIERILIENPKFIDRTYIHRIKRGVIYEETKYCINEDEKKNLCIWICNNCGKEEFINFKSVFDLMSLIID